MKSSTRKGRRPANRKAEALPARMTEQMAQLRQAGRWDQLAASARIASTRHPRRIEGWQELSRALLHLGQWAPAAEALSRVIRLAPGDAGAHNDLGSACYRLGREAEAETCYLRALECDPRSAKAHNNLGALLAEGGRLAEATVHFQQALELHPGVAGPHNNLGCVLRDLGRLSEAEPYFRAALKIDPDYFDACINLGLALFDLDRLAAAQQSYRRALEINPDSALALHCLGSLLDRAGGQDDEAAACLERSILLNPDNVDTYHTLGNMLLRSGQLTRSQEVFRRARTLCPLIYWPARKEPADFSVLLLDAPGPGCTPVVYLAGGAPYDAHFYCVLPGAPEHLELLRAKADVVVNLIADPDSGKELLPCARDLVELLGRPTLNHPTRVMCTDRETVARRLSGIPWCRIPRTLALTGPELAEALADRHLEEVTWPLLVRLAGNHGGDDFEKVADWHDLAAFVSRNSQADHYLTEYLDYRSADGFFRKYRFICIDGELFPYHLAIHDHWKVHHFRTDTANQAWMRREEAAFLRDPQLVFDASCQQALRAVAAATELDYCGIDCALDGDGQVVVFEANAAMLVHDEKDPKYAYKNPFIARIKEAFDAKLARLAGEGWPAISSRPTET